MEIKAAGDQPPCPNRRPLNQILRVMKITIILLTVLCLHVSARSWSQKVTLSVKNMPLQKVFTLIEKQTGYAFFYDLDLLNGRTASLDVKDAEITAVLKECLRDLPLDFKVVNTTIAIIKRQPPKIVAELAPAPRSETEVKGQVKTEAGAPMPDATVTLISGKIRKSIATNAEGEFVVPDLPKGKYTMEITFIGYETFRREVIIGDQPIEVSAILKAAISGLDETVVKGYYNTTKRLNTGNVTTVKGEDIQKQPVSDPILALEGRVPGLYISQYSGIPGAGLIVQLRGQNSIANGNNPLYIIDGVPITATSITNTSIGGGAVGSPGPGEGLGQGMSPFNSLDPSDIESIDILKDADATAIYGSRGANGVILITTRKGKAGQTKVDLNVYTGVGKIARKMNLLNTQQYLAMRYKGFYNDSIEDPLNYVPPDPTFDYDLLGWDTTRYTDWQKVLTGGTAQLTNAHASLSGGNANTQFLLGGGYTRQNTVFPGNYSDQKASVNANINHVSANQRFRTLFQAQYVNDNSNLPPLDLTSYITLAPDAPALYDVKGNLNWQDNTWTNPLSYTLSRAYAKTDNLVSSLNLSYEIIHGLQLKSNFGYTHIQMNQSIQTPATEFYGPPVLSNRSNQTANNNINSWIIEPQLIYDAILGQGKINVLLGATFQQNMQNSQAVTGYGFLSDALIPNIGSASALLGSSSYTKYRYNALFGRVGYNWKERYLINLTARRDGSSRFGPGNQFGNFGAIGAAWIFSKENFIQRGLPFLSFGKLRSSYGTTGNDQLTDYQYLSTYTSLSSTYQGITGLYPSRIANPYFGWEVVKKLEMGLELGFAHDRIQFGISYYRNRSGNQLVKQPLPSVNGFTSIMANLPAVVQNTGLELSINTINIKTRDFSWTSSVNLTIPRNKLVSFPNLANSASYRNAYAIGKPLFIQHLYHYTGVNPQTGVYVIQDVNKDGMINSLDQQFFKQIAKDYFGGFQNSFSYKGWQLDIFFQFVKQTGSNFLANFGIPGTFNQNMPTYILNAWQKPGDLASLQKYTASYGSAASNVFGSYYSISDATISDASFIRLKNVSLSYQVKGLNNLHIRSARVYLQCQNLLTFTNYLGLDPENQRISLPPIRMVTAGIEVGL